MQLIPVLDLRAGQVVRAVRGERGAYQSVRSVLCDSAEPLAVARALVRHTGARTLYLADLDALQGGAAQVAVLRQLLADDPTRHWWVDAGFATVDDALHLRAQLGAAAAQVSPVFGSESLRSLAELGALARNADALGQPVLSLDRRAGQALDPAGCWQAPALWPQRVIVMTLERVGSGQGPDLATLSALRQQPSAVRCWVGSGGVRHADDLAAGAAAGAQAWLVASALHDGQL